LTDAAVERALASDPPSDPAFPAETLPHAISSGSVTLNALLYTAAGAGPHPAVLLLHGLPGNEQNIDLAQSLRRAGWTVLTFHYRGSWGSPGAFSFANCIEDAEAALDWLIAGAGESPRIDGRAVVVIGHSMGGFLAAHLAAHRPQVRAAALLSAADLGPAFGDLPVPRAVAVLDKAVGGSEGLRILADTSPRALAREAGANAGHWRLRNFAPALGNRPLLLCTSDDGFTPGSDALAGAIGDATRVTRAHFPADHSYSGHRIALQRTVLRWLFAMQHADFD
jgi:pimeloyl-ACP methyl ester carboxylesterase